MEEQKTEKKPHQFKPAKPYSRGARERENTAPPKHSQRRFPETFAFGGT